MQLLRQPAATGVNTRVVCKRSRTLVTKVCAKEECRGGAAAATHTRSVRRMLTAQLLWLFVCSHLCLISASGVSQLAWQHHTAPAAPLNLCHRPWAGHKLASYSVYNVTWSAHVMKGVNAGTRDILCAGRTPVHSSSTPAVAT
jgi:hypothetical protein